MRVVVIVAAIVLAVPARATDLCTRVRALPVVVRFRMPPPPLPPSLDMGHATSFAQCGRAAGYAVFITPMLDLQPARIEAAVLRPGSEQLPGYAKEDLPSPLTQAAFDASIDRMLSAGLDIVVADIATAPAYVARANATLIAPRAQLCDAMRALPVKLTVTTVLQDGVVYPIHIDDFTTGPCKPSGTGRYETTIEIGTKKPWSYPANAYAVVVVTDTKWRLSYAELAAGAEEPLSQQSIDAMVERAVALAVAGAGAAVAEEPALEKREAAECERLRAVKVAFSIESGAGSAALAKVIRDRLAERCAHVVVVDAGKDVAAAKALGMSHVLRVKLGVYASTGDYGALEKTDQRRYEMQVSIDLVSTTNGRSISQTSAAARIITTSVDDAVVRWSKDAHPEILVAVDQSAHELAQALAR